MDSHRSPHDGLIRACGTALALGGLVAAGLNLVLTPRLPVSEGLSAVAASSAFGLRMPLAALVVVLTLAGCLGLYLVQAHRLRWGWLVFLITAVGSLMVFCIECVQFTLVRDLAFAIPDQLEQLDADGALSRYDTGFAIGGATIALGWIGVAGVTLATKAIARRGPLALLAGILLIPILGAAVGLWGAVAGNVVLGAGWFLMGLDLRRATAG